MNVNSTASHQYPELTTIMQKSVKQARSGKRPKVTRAILGVGVECDMTPEGEYILPEDQGLCVDLLYRARNRRLEIEHEAERVQKLENMLKEHFINTLSANSTGLAGRVALVKVEPKPIPQVADWDVFYKWVRKNNAFEMLQRRLNETAVNERLDDKKIVPGVTIFRAKKVSVTKL